MTVESVVQVAAAVLLSVASGGAIVLALASWLGKVWASRIMERERADLKRAVNAELERLRGVTEQSLFVHRTQFEVEFRAYQELWAAIFEAVVRALALRPVMDRRPADTSDEELMAERERQYAAEHNKTLSVWRRYRPFITTEIDQLVEALLKATRSEVLSATILHKDDLVAYWDDQEAKCKAINAASDALCEAIRHRIGLMKPTE